MTSDESALLAAIRANPDEDTVRLEYADWLDEFGDPDRADYIREEVARCRRGGTTLRRNGIYWMRRGFAEEVECDAKLWLGHAETILAMPFAAVRRVRWTAFTDDDREVFWRLWVAAGNRDAFVIGRLFPDLAADVWKGVAFELPPLIDANWTETAADAEFEAAGWDVDDYDDYPPEAVN